MSIGTRREQGDRLAASVYTSKGCHSILSIGEPLLADKPQSRQLPDRQEHTRATPDELGHTAPAGANREIEHVATAYAVSERAALGVKRERARRPEAPAYEHRHWAAAVRSGKQCGGDQILGTDLSAERSDPGSVQAIEEEADSPSDRGLDAAGGAVACRPNLDRVADLPLHSAVHTEHQHDLSVIGLPPADEPADERAVGLLQKRPRVRRDAGARARRSNRHGERGEPGGGAGEEHLHGS